MIKELVFATANAHKLEEVQMLLGNQFELKSLTDINCHDDIEETGSTFRENASIKSNYIYKHYKENCFADDSGLEVEALNNEPGVYSARYSGSRDMQTNLQLVLRKLEGISDRRANFRTVISLIVNGSEHFFEGIVNGVILEKPTGEAGFGYDPIFMPDGYSESFAQMPLEQKNKISHRAIAISKLIEFLKANSF